MMGRGMWVLAGLLALAGCSDTPPTGPTAGAGEDTRLVGATIFADAVATASGTPDRDNAAVVLSNKARIGAVPSSQTGGRELGIAVVGTETTMSYDIDGNGAGDDIYVFVTAVDSITFIAWELQGRCNLGWIDGPLAFQIIAPCGGGEVIGCSSAVGTDVHACNVCRSGACEACEVDGTTIKCAEPEVEPEAQPEGEPEGEPEGPLCDPPCSGGTQCVDGECIGDVEPDHPPVTSGECEPSCLEQSGAVCCTECGCDGFVKCAPICGSGFMWDCEIGCCFDYEVFECECPADSVYDAEKNCCAVDGVCLDQ